MCNQMHSTVFLESGIVDAPEAVDAVCFLDTSRDHHGVVLRREVIGDVQHDVAYNAADGGESVWCDVFEGVLVGGRIF
jgi:hypothetical protein